MYEVKDEIKDEVVVIDKFRGEFRFLSNFHPANITIDDKLY